MSEVRRRFDLYLNTNLIKEQKVAEAVIIEEQGYVEKVAFRYHQSYLDSPHFRPLDPIALPKSDKPVVLQCKGAYPGILDDYLPDDWGRKVITQLAFLRDQNRISAYSALDTLKYIGNSRIGALQWVPENEKPNYESGAYIGNLHKAEEAAQRLDSPELTSDQIDEIHLLYLANAGTGVGGARPKALLYDDNGTYLAKFNRLSKDSYNNARVELACLKMAKAAGLNVGTAKIVEGIKNREVLLLDRFDLDKKGRRKHLITINALLKEPGSQRDSGEHFRYNDIQQLIQRHSINVVEDLKSLLRMMLFNRAINNTDDHQRNFSMILTDDGYTLAPAYDMVPAIQTGSYHCAGFNYSGYPPRLGEVQNLGKIFGLEKTTIKTIADEIRHAVSEWEYHAEQSGVNEQDTLLVKRYMKPD